MKKIFPNKRYLFFILILLVQTAFSQTEEDKKEMRQLIDRLKNAEAKTTEITQKEEKRIQDSLSWVNRAEYHINHPVKWDSVENIINDKGEIIDKIFKTKPAEAIAYENKTADLNKEGFNLMQIQDDISREKEDNAIEIAQAKRLIQLKQKWFKISGWFTSAGCGEMPGTEASADVLKAFYDCLFDKSNPNPDPLPAPRPTWKAVPNDDPHGPLWEYSPELKKKMQTSGTVVPPPLEQKEKPGISDHLKDFLNNANDYLKNIKKRRFDVRTFTSDSVRG